MDGGGKGKGSGSGKGCQTSGGKGSEGSASKGREGDRACVRRCPYTDVRAGYHWARIRASTAGAETAYSPRAPLAAPLSVAPDEPIADAEMQPDPEPFLEPEAVPPEQPGPPGPPEPMVQPHVSPMEEPWYIDRLVSFVFDHPSSPERRIPLAASGSDNPDDPFWLLPAVEWTPHGHYQECGQSCPCCRFRAREERGSCDWCRDAWTLTTVSRYWHRECRRYLGEATYQSWSWKWRRA